MKGTVLVIDDEKDLIELVRYNLGKEGLDVIAAADGESGLAIAGRHAPDLVVLDLMLPGMDGLDVCRRLRGEHATARLPILMLTAKAAESDRIVGLELGADDYLAKPFSPRELVARVKALLRRAAPPEEATAVHRCGELLVDVGRHEVAWRGRPVSLTATEFRVLVFLAARRGRVLSRTEIIDGALGRDVAVIDRTIDVHVTSLRKKLGSGGDLLETIRGFGYKFRVAPPPAAPSAPTSRRARPSRPPDPNER
ncbi:MAG: response regulator transcription factor [Planctomycetes bacterium]|nr:response regulator transcription factor [Planctomycetota bacterium]